jgi:hypothetical protein
MTSEVDDLLSSLNAQRRLFADPWFGLVLTVGSNERCNMKLDYDPRCSEDASFFND